MEAFARGTSDAQPEKEYVSAPHCSDWEMGGRTYGYQRNNIVALAN